MIVVEHDEDTMRAADYVVDVGPGAGVHGGEIVAAGTVEEIIACPASVTGQYLSGALTIPVPARRKKPAGWLTVLGASEHNLKDLDVRIPLGVMCCVTGVSGSGKSSLVNEIIYKQLARQLNRAKTRPGAFRAMEGAEQLDKDPLWWPQERPVPMRVPRGPFGIPLPLMPGPKTLCELRAGT